MQIYANSRQVVLSEVVHRLEEEDRPESRITLGRNPESDHSQGVETLNFP